jgi:hypothetical protein
MNSWLNPLSIIERRHPELVSPCGDFVPGSIKRAQSIAAKWTLKQVQGDGVLGSVS